MRIGIIGRSDVPFTRRNGRTRNDRRISVGRRRQRLEGAQDVAVEWGRPSFLDGRPADAFAGRRLRLEGPLFDSPEAVRADSV